MNFRDLCLYMHVNYVIFSHCSALKILVESENDRLIVLYHKGLQVLGDVSRQRLIFTRIM